MVKSLCQHWPEYLMEAACLGIFMVSAGVFAALLAPRPQAVHRSETAELRHRMVGVNQVRSALQLCEKVPLGLHADPRQHNSRTNNSASSSEFSTNHTFQRNTR